ncbi:hypothetical protein GCM10008967_04150 [Bacillus carboniphilus]|uniref:Spo0E like sporulation regulatory protein n=1 Tax=Bacillus carboniphilus TaxID=86663 RepID=A0ABN0VTS3_9BACI
MDDRKAQSLEMISHDIHVLRGLMYKVKERVGSMDDPLVLEISQYLDSKLNQQGEMIKSIR